MANFQCVDLDDSSFERIRELLSHCRGSKTRVALSRTDGWKSGKNSLLHKHKKKKVPLSCIHNLIQDEKFINVLLCVFAVQVANSDDPKLEVVAFKFRSPEDAHDIVTRFQEWTNTVPLESSVNGSVLLSRSSAIMTPMPGRPTNGNITPSHWISPTSSGSRPQMSSSAGDLTSTGVFYGHQQHTTSRSTAEARRTTSNDRPTVTSDDGSVVFSDADMDGVAIARVNGGQRTGSLSPDFEDVDNSTLPIRLVYARPPSTPANNHHHHYDFTTRRERYHSVDGVSLQQPTDVRSQSVGRYYLSSSRSDLCSVNGGGSRVVPASRVYYRPAATLINPRFNKNKQYVPRSAGVVVGSRANTAYRAVPRSRAGSDWR